MRIASMSGVLLIAHVCAMAHAQCEPVWSSLGGLDGRGSRALAVHDDDGSGPAPPVLFVGNGIGDHFLFARWDGWSATPVGGPHESSVGIYSLVIVPESTGLLAPGLYAGGGDMTLAGGVPVNNLARWADGAWHDVGGGVTQPGIINPYVFAMEVFDEDGEGPLPPALFVGGQFEHAGGVAAHALARWDGTEWSVVGGGMGSPTSVATIRAMTVYDDGRGPALYVGGSFNFAGGQPAHDIARWDGRAWEPVGPGFNGSVKALGVFDEDGPGAGRPSLVAGGAFSTVRGGATGSMRGISQWDGAQWAPVGGTLNVGSVSALAVFDQDGAGPAKESLFVGGTINRLPGSIPVNHLVRWDGEQWHDVGGGVTGFGAGTSVRSLAVFDEDGPGPNPGGLYVGGLFYRAGAVETRHIARWGCPLPASRPCYADCDGDGELAFFDFLCFQNLFAAGDVSADCDQSGRLDFFDFLCFQNAFAAGCP